MIGTDRKERGREGRMERREEEWQKKRRREEEQKKEGLLGCRNVG